MHSLHTDNPSKEFKKYLQKLSSRVLLYCLFLKEFGHISVRLISVPLVYLTFSNNTNLFLTLIIDQSFQNAILRYVYYIGAL